MVWVLPVGAYEVIISLDKGTINGVDDVEVGLIYDIYSYVFELGLYPSRIAFLLLTSGGKADQGNVHVSVREDDFNRIKSLEDLKPFVENAIEFRDMLLSRN